MQLQRVLFGKMAKKYVFCSVRTQCGQNKRQNVKFICEYNAKTQLRIKTDAHTQELNNLKIKRNNLSLSSCNISTIFRAVFQCSAEQNIIMGTYFLFFVVVVVRTFFNTFFWRFAFARLFLFLIACVHAFTCNAENCISAEIILTSYDLPTHQAIDVVIIIFSFSYVSLNCRRAFFVLGCRCCC